MSSFFLISEYLLGNSRILSRNDVFKFWIRRLNSTYVLYLVACCLMVIVLPQCAQGAVQLLLSFLGLSCLISPPLQTLWFYSLLLFFYFLTPFIIRNYINGEYYVIYFKIIIIFILISVIDIIFHCVDMRVFYYYPIYCLGIIIKLSNKISAVRVIKKQSLYLWGALL